MDKQLEILKFVKSKGIATKDEIINAMPWGYYCNGRKHFGDMIGRMIKNKQLRRVKNGVYEYVSDLGIKYHKVKNITIDVDENQIELF